MSLFSIIDPFAVNFGSVYLQYAHFIDAAIALIIFLSISQWVFSKKFKGKEGKMVAIGVSMALTFGFIMFELETGFTFGNLDGLAAIMILLIFGVLVYELLVGLFGEERKRCAFAFSYFLMYGLFMVPYSSLYGLVAGRYPLVWSILGILYIVSLIQIIICIIGMFGGGKGGESGGQRDSGETGGRRNPPPQPTLPLRVQITQPANGSKFPLGTDVPLGANISGGTGNYVWSYEPRVNCTPLQGTGSTANTLIRMLPIGPHTIEVTVRDGKSTERVRIGIIIEAAALPASATLDRELDVIERILRDLSGRTPLQATFAGPFTRGMLFAVENTGTRLYDAWNAPTHATERANFITAVRNCSRDFTTLNAQLNNAIRLAAAPGALTTANTARLVQYISLSAEATTRYTRYVTSYYAALVARRPLPL